MKKRHFGCSSLVLALAAGGVMAADCAPTATLTPTTSYFQQAFGQSAAFHLGGNGARDLLIGAPRDTVGNVSYAGSVGVYHYDPESSNWSFSQLLTAPAGASCDFGASTSIFMNRCAIGAPGSDGGCDDGGSICFTERNDQIGQWSAPVRFVAPGTQTSDFVGRSVAVYNTEFGTVDVMAAGAPGDDSDLIAPVGEETQDSGAVHIWRRIDNGPWLYVQKLRRTAPTTALAAFQNFGQEVAMGGNTLIASAPGGEVQGGPANTGLVMVYGKSDQNLWVSASGNGYVHPLAQSGDSYGAAVDTQDGVMVVGAPFGDSTAADTPLVGAKSDCGYIEILLRGQNSVQSAGRFFPPDASTNEGFGWTVDQRGFEILVGTAPGVGKVYVYRPSGNGWTHWALHRVIHNSSATQFFGSALASEYEWICVTDAGETYGQNGAIKGIAYVYKTSDYVDPSDSCSRAVYNPLDAEGSYTGCSSHYTLGAYTTCGGTQANQGPDLFYAFVPHCSGAMVADTFGSEFDTVLSVHASCPPDINPNNPNALTNTIACNDDDAQSNTTQSKILFNVVEGQTYIFRIAGYNGARGNYVLNFHALTPPPNDQCTQAQVIGLGSTPYVTCGATTDGPTDSIAACDVQPAQPRKDIWFRYTAAAPGTITAETCDANVYTMLQAFAAGACPASNVEALSCGYENSPCDILKAARMSVNVSAGATYLIRLSSPRVEFFAQTGYGTLTMSFLPARCPCDWNQSGTVSVQDIFDFLASYFSGSGDFNNSGATSVQDIFDFLACYFAGC